MGGTITGMFESFRKLISDISDGAERSGQFDEDDYRVAAAALLIHAAAVDGKVSDAERGRLRGLIMQRFNLDEADAERLIAEATEVEQEAIDLYHFTARLNRALDEKGRARMVEMMWQVVFADGAVSEFEDNLIWRAADLLHVSRPERIALRNRVAGNQ
jgi:uncharacterized tellurite resistance protein B-like protein